MVVFAEGEQVRAKFMATKMGPFGTKFLPGVISKVYPDPGKKDDKYTYDINYENGKSEANVKAQFVKEPLAETAGTAAPTPKLVLAPEAKQPDPKSVQKEVKAVAAQATPVAKPEPKSAQKASAGPTDASSKRESKLTKASPDGSDSEFAAKPSKAVASAAASSGKAEAAASSNKRVRKQVDYNAAEDSDGESEEDAAASKSPRAGASKGKASKPKKVVAESESEEYEEPSAEGSADEESEAEAEAESEPEDAPKKKPAKAAPKAAERKPAAKKAVAARPKRTKKAASPEPASDSDEASEGDEEDEDDDAFDEEKAPVKKAAKPRPKAKGSSSYEKSKWTEEEIAELPVLTKPQEMFDEMVAQAEARARTKGSALEGHSLAELAQRLEGRKLRVATMCSGTESPVLALDMISKSLFKQCGVQLEMDHVFSCEIEPFKQAYIERNFAPPTLFRDIRELDGEQATTAYGSLRDVPGDVDILIAGTSCVDFSNMNTQRKELGADKGELSQTEPRESSQTFFGMLGWVKRHRPPIIIQENVCGAPWAHMIEQYAKEGYTAHSFRVDTKHYYIPHTRTRVYLIAVDSRAGGAKAGCTDDEALVSRCEFAVNALSRPSSASLEAFLLPSDDSRVHRAREALSKPKTGGRDKSMVDWGRCETRHQRARGEENLGLKRPMTHWVSQGHCKLPDFAWGDWAKAQVERVLDLMDINWLRLSSGTRKTVFNNLFCQDANFKTMLWNLSQNVDRSTGSEGKPGICPCLTPNMVPYLTNRGGPLIGEEVLSLQGIPVDDLLLTKESEDQMADLAGNAMTSTVVGACIISALVLRQDSLLALTKEPPAKAEKSAGKSPSKSPAKGKAAAPLTSLGGSTKHESTRLAEARGALALEEAPLQLSAAPCCDLRGLLHNAARSARMCTSEGRSGLAESILRCTECGTTVSAKCQSTPEHKEMEEVMGERMGPRDFEAQLKATLPMCLHLRGLDAASDARPDGALLLNKSEAKAAAAAAKATIAEAKGKGKAAKPTPTPMDEDSGDDDGDGADSDAAEEAAAIKAAQKGLAQPGLNSFFGKKPEPAEPAVPAAQRSPVAPRSAAKRSAQSPSKEQPPAKKGGGSADDALWHDWLEALGALDGSRFYFQSVTRGSNWVAKYAAEGGAGQLLLEMRGDVAEWQLYATPPNKRGPLRDLLVRPVARMRVTAASPELLGGQWELCLPQTKLLHLTVSPVGEMVASNQAASGLEAQWDGSVRCKRWSVAARPEDTQAALDVDISGEYELLDKCGCALGSLHKRVGGGAPVFFFLDPSRTGDGEYDFFVFSESFERLGYGETRRSLGELDRAWRPWDLATVVKVKGGEDKIEPPAPRKPRAVAYTVRGQWCRTELSLTQVAFADAAVATPPAALQLGVEAAEAAPAAVQVLRCKVPLSEAEAAGWPEGAFNDIPLSRSKATFEAISWITDRLRLPETLEGWASISAGPAVQRWMGGGSPCELSAPTVPTLSWVNAGKGKLIAVEDPVQAGQFEQRLKHRPQPFVVQRSADRSGDGGALVGSLRIAANPASLGMRALATVPLGKHADQAALSWRVVKHSDESGGPAWKLPQLQISSNKQDVEAEQPPHFKKFDGRSKRLPVLELRKEQQRSLSWMLRQEEEAAAPFFEEEVAEAVLPALGWRLEARARVPRVARGGVLADEVGYGKTVITIALIDSAPRVPIPPPPPLAPKAFIPVKATLVLAPSHLLKQWPREIEKFSGGALKTATINTMADLNKLSIKDIQKLDVIVCGITIFRNDLYYSRLANLAGSESLPSAKSSRHFEHSYQEAMARLGERTAELSGGDSLAEKEEGLAQMRSAVKAGQAARKEARSTTASDVVLSLGNTEKRMYARSGALLKGKKATYAAEKKQGKKAAADEDDEAEEEEDEAEEEDEDDEPPKKAAKPAAKGKGKAAAAKKPPAKKAKRVADSDDDDEEDDFIDDDESDDDDEAPKKKGKGKSAAAKKAGAKPKTEEEADPWGLFSGNVRNNWSNLQAPPLEMFYWNRLVVDEYTYNNERDQTAIVHGLKANARWVLSGTPNVSGFGAVSTIAQWLGVHLGSADSSELSTRAKKEQSASERFQQFSDVKTGAWHAARHVQAQLFLDRYVRQNIAEIDEIPWREQAVKVRLPPAERALYIELKNHLEALDMKNNHKTIKSKCKSENDREARLAAVLGGSDSPDEALLKRCAHFDLNGASKTAAAACDEIVSTRQQQLEQCRAEIVRQTGFARDAINFFEARHPKKKLNDKELEHRAMPRKHFDDFCSGDPKAGKLAEVEECGDADAVPLAQACVKEGMTLAVVAEKEFKKMTLLEKGLKDQMAWTRDQVHLLRRLLKELTARVRSLRFFENVRLLQREGEKGQGASSSGAAIKMLLAGRPAALAEAPASELALLSCCGHLGRLGAVVEAANQQECVHDGCKAAVRPTCCLPAAELGGMGGDDAKEGVIIGGRQQGAKLSAVVRLIKSTPGDERVLVFVQFMDLLVKVHEALTAAGVPTAMLKGTANQRSTIIESFQSKEEVKKGEPRVLLLNLRDESAAGANLTAANHAIFLHPLLVQTQQEYDACDTQAVGRIRRYGQQRTVQLYRFLVDTTIDTDIFLQRRGAEAEALLQATDEPIEPIEPMDED